MLGIYDWFGYEVPIKERYQIIKDAGFDQVMLWWSDGFGRGVGYQQGVQYAREAGLWIQNIHTPVQEQNNLSFDNLDGESVYQCYNQCILDCSIYQIPTMVIHLPNDKYPINDLGMERIKRLTDQAEQQEIKVAFENLDNVHNLEYVLSTVDSNHIGFCYDSCHHANYSAKNDLLGKYGRRLMALHLHDNGGKRNQHQLPFDGNIDWISVMKSIKRTEYTGGITLEPMNWGYESLTIHEYLHRAYTKAKELADFYQK